MRKNFSTILIVGAALLLASCVQQKESFSPVDYVNPLMGTESTYAFSHGNTYPAVAVPWGMNFWSPQTGENGSGWMYTVRNDRQDYASSLPNVGAGSKIVTAGQYIDWYYTAAYGMDFGYSMFDM